MTSVHGNPRASRWAMLTAYDFPTGPDPRPSRRPGALVGDSVGRNVLGYAERAPGDDGGDAPSHARAWRVGVEHAMVVGDMPFMSFQASIEDGDPERRTAWIKEGGAHAVKIEGAQFDLVHRLVDIGIPVMAHIGLTPQSVYGLGGYRVQGTRRGGARRSWTRRTRSRRREPSRSCSRRCRRDLGAEIAQGAADPHDRDRCGKRHGCAGAGDQRSARAQSRRCRSSRRRTRTCGRRSRGRRRVRRRCRDGRVPGRASTPTPGPSAAAGRHTLAA